MVTNYPQGVTAASLPAPTGLSARGLFQRVVAAVQHALCSLHGHDNLLHFEEKRIFLRCTSCGHETPGWELDKARPRLKFHGDPDRQMLPASPRLVETRRIA